MLFLLLLGEKYGILNTIVDEKSFGKENICVCLTKRF